MRATVDAIQVVGHPIGGGMFQVEAILDARAETLTTEVFESDGLFVTRKIRGVLDARTGRIRVTAPGKWKPDYEKEYKHG